MNVTQLFNTDLPAALAANSAEAKTIGAKFQFNVTGAGEWFMDLTKDGPTCVPGSGKADCTVTIHANDFQKLMENPKANAMSLFFGGKLKVAGNQMLGMRLEKILGYVQQ